MSARESKRKALSLIGYHESIFVALDARDFPGIAATFKRTLTYFSSILNQILDVISINSIADITNERRQGALLLGEHSLTFIEICQTDIDLIFLPIS